MPAPETPKLTTDCLIVAPDGHLLLIRRKNDPFKGTYALPGGFVDVGETVEQACVREVKEETNLDISPDTLKMIGVYSDPERDPRGHSVTVAFRAALPDGQVPKPGDDAAETELVAYSQDLEIGFDHHLIIQDGLAL